MHTLSEISEKLLGRFLELSENSQFSYTDLSNLTGISRSALQRYLTGETKKFPLDRVELIAKALNLPMAYVMGWNTETTHAYVQIPVVGQVIAGIPTQALEEIIDWEEIPAAMAARGDYVGLRVKGNSMEPRICAGDVVIIRRQDTIESGELAVVFVNGDEATLKKFKRVDGGIMLVAFNSSVYEPHFYSNKEIADLPVKIYGKVVELRGKF